MGTHITLKAADGVAIDAYRADPQGTHMGTPKGGLVVCQEIFGVNHHIRNVCDRFAAEGYLAIAPALFDRAERGVEYKYDQDGIAKGVALMKQIPMEDTLQDVQAAIAVAKEAGKVGIVGFCWGGSIAWAAAAKAEGLSAAIGYYGGMIGDMVHEHLRCPVMLHFGEQDQSIPAEVPEKVRAAHPEVPVHLYPAGHGFNCDERGSYDAESAREAMNRTLGFLRQHVG